MIGLLLIATLGGQCIAVDAGRIEAVVDLAEVVAVPRAPAHVAGLSAVRSRVVTVIDATGRIPSSGSDRRRALLLEHHGHAYALLVDAVLDAALPVAKPVDPRLPAASPWATVATGSIDTDHGLALIIDPLVLIDGQPLTAEAA